MEEQNSAMKTPVKEDEIVAADIPNELPSQKEDADNELLTDDESNVSTDSSEDNDPGLEVTIKINRPLEKFFRKHNLKCKPSLSRSSSKWSLSPMEVTLALPIRIEDPKRKRLTSRSPTPMYSKKVKTAWEEDDDFEPIPISKWEENLNDQPVTEAELKKMATAWGDIKSGQLVYVLLNDDEFYSGVIVEKGLNENTWNVTFDDGERYVAPESDIIPITVLGVGVKGVYTHYGDNYEYDGEFVEIVGQKIDSHPDTGNVVIKYAVKLDNEQKLLWCSRRQFSITEADAKSLRLDNEGKKALFKGIQFFITVNTVKNEEVIGKPTLPDEPFIEERIKENIRDCGGELVEKEGKESSGDVFLISNTYARTQRYLYCLSKNIPCVSHTWITECLKKNQLVDWKPFQLPAGWSILDNQIIQPHQNKPLKGCKIFIALHTNALVNYWKSILLAAGAELLETETDNADGTIIPEGTDIVLGDKDFMSAEKLLHEATERNLQVVKSEWIMQAIIKGEKPGSHPRDNGRLYLQE